MNKAIFQSFKAFYLGFHSVCASNALIVSVSLPSMQPLSLSVCSAHETHSRMPCCRRCSAAAAATATAAAFVVRCCDRKKWKCLCAVDRPLTWKNCAK